MMILSKLFCSYLIHNNPRGIFFFKQKTAYDMRIRDWSSDVFSSDLLISPELRGVVGILDQRKFGLGRAFVAVLGHIGGDADRCLDQIGRASCRERVCQYV